eukprot:c7945_g1_i2.p1 GENE.c7945_g1_i2~~c7945_g1_i2.p1  ORF type:complete len:390 (+),score=75.39 c7945_g1_i2:1-1170(+)
MGGGVLTMWLLLVVVGCFIAFWSLIRQLQSILGILKMPGTSIPQALVQPFAVTLESNQQHQPQQLPTSDPNDDSCSDPPVPCTFTSDGRLGCAHYLRGCALWCRCCQQWRVCLRCHDESADHEYDRFSTEEVGCMTCGTRQPIGPLCISCGKTFAQYFCEKCKFFDDSENKSIYHCPHCNLCRVGRGLGIDFEHCFKCNACLSKPMFSSHQCTERVLDQNCPVCHEFMFTSTRRVVFLKPCSHAVHYQCLDALLKFSTKCPICKTNVIDMSNEYHYLDIQLKNELKSTEMFLIGCNDCHKRSVCNGVTLNTKRYFLCDICLSYNTNAVHLVPPSELTSTIERYRLSPNTIRRIRKESIHVSRSIEAENNSLEDSDVEAEFIEEAVVSGL